MNRRNALRFSVSAGLAALAYPAFSDKKPVKPRFKIGACDWSIGPAGDINTFEVAKKIGLDGVQLSLNTKTDHEHLRKPDLQRQFREAAHRAGVKIGGLRTRTRRRERRAEKTARIAAGEFRADASRTVPNQSIQTENFHVRRRFFTAAT